MNSVAYRRVLRTTETFCNISENSPVVRCKRLRQDRLDEALFRENQDTYGSKPCSSASAWHSLSGFLMS